MEHGRLKCPNCDTQVPDISKERGRFKRRHPKLCIERQDEQTEKALFTQQLSEEVKSVE